MLNERPERNLLTLAGVDPEIFYNLGEDIRISEDHTPVARIFRRKGKIVYRAGTAVEWDSEEDGHPVS